MKKTRWVALRLLPCDTGSSSADTGVQGPRSPYSRNRTLHGCLRPWGELGLWVFGVTCSWLTQQPSHIWVLSFGKLLETVATRTQV